MKIVHIFLSGPMNDGWSYQENMLTKYHKKLGYDVTFIATKQLFNEMGEVISTDQCSYYDDYGVKVIRLCPKKWGLKGRLAKYEGLYKTLCNEKPDIIFLHCFQLRDSRTVADYVKKNNVVLYADNHADYSNSASNWLSKKVLHSIIWKYYANMLAPYVKKFYGVMPSRVEFMTELYGLNSNKCELLVMGADDELVEKYDTDENRIAIRKKYHIDENAFLIVTGGKIDLYKKQTITLMKTVKEIKNVNLIVFGSVDKSIRTQVENELDNKRVQYIGWLNTEQSYSIFSAADLVVFPGRHSVFWEQVVAQGIPMICKKWKGTTHIDVGGNVIFLNGDSGDELKARICEIINDPQKYNNMKKIAETKGRETFSYKNIAERAIS